MRHPTTWSMRFRGIRHSPCIMSPLTLLGMAVLMAVALLSLILKFPTMLIGFLLQPLLLRSNFLVEFLYPWTVGKWVHFFMIRLANRARGRKNNDKSYGFHTRAMEQRFEVIEKKVYVHPLPQLLDNLGYLLICLPDSSDGNILALVIDCGDADVVERQIQIISEKHYKKRPIHVHSILSTHKHHDHTGGNIRLKRRFRDTLMQIMGGAIERVPGCNHPLADGDLVPLPRDETNDMRRYIEIEAVATPAHTRGSLSYVLRPFAPVSTMNALVFTGDTMFSGGAGVPFEADIEPNQEEKANSKSNADSFIKASAAGYATERCFSEILARCIPHDQMPGITSDRVVIFPGHEYTSDLLQRQFMQPSEACRWKYFSPRVFFELASHYYTAQHRRGLPSNSGNLLVASSPLSREVLINPNFRSMRRRGEVVVTAVSQWHKRFCRNKVPQTVSGGYGVNGTIHFLGRKSHHEMTRKSRSSEKQWNLDGRDLCQPVFATVYAADLQSFVRDLEEGRVGGREAAQRLQEMTDALNTSVIGRRPIPATLPSSKTVYKGLVGFCILGSAPNALTMSDSLSMRLPLPVNRSDHYLVSKSRLIAVLYWLGLLGEEDDGQRTVHMIENLWAEALDVEGHADIDRRYDAVGMEENNKNNDVVELGTLKWIVYGIPTRRPKWSFCLPCGGGPEQDVTSHPAHDSGLEREHGELVRHDLFTDPMCVGAAGNPDNDLEYINPSTRIDTSSFEMAHLEDTRE